MDKTKSNEHPLTYKLSNILLGLVGVYLLLNLVFLYLCLSHELPVDAPTRLSRALEPIGGVLPVIYRPVEWLAARGDTERAGLVTQVYAFAWVSAVLFALLMSLTTYFYVRWLPEAAKNTARDLFISAARLQPYSRRQEAQTGFSVMIVLSLMVLVDAAIGFFTFENWSFISNMVHVRDRDLFRVALDLTLLLLFSLMLFVGWAKKTVLSEAA